MLNHFKTLGIPLDATESDAKKAYRSLAMKYHPDRGGNEEKFKALSLAYTAVSKAIKGGAKFQQNDFSECTDRARAASAYWENQSYEKAAGFDLSFDIHVYPVQMAYRIKQRFSFCRSNAGGNGSEDVHLMITIPPGTKYGDTLRFRGMGSHGRNGGAPGDLYLTFRKKIVS